MKVKVINAFNNDLPVYKTKGSSGMDIYSASEVTIEKGKIGLVKTGLFLEIPDGYEIQIRPRSGLALKYGITVLNTPGSVDSDFRGELCVILINHGKESFTVFEGDRIAQMILAKVEKIEWVEVDVIEETTRGSSGFGSTGI